MNEKYTFEFIEAYLSGNLSPDESQAFEQAMKADDTLAKEVDSQKAAHHAVALYTQIKTKENVADLYSKVKGKGQAKVRRLGPMALAATVIFLVFMGLAYFFISSSFSGSGLVASTLEPYPDRITSMSDSPTDDMSAAMQAYNQKDYPNAIQLFGKLTSDNRHYQLSRLYMGIAQLETGQPGDAVTTLYSLNNMENDLKEPAQWYLALAQLAHGDEASARAHFEEVVENGGYQADKAASILKKLNSGWRNFPGVR